MRIALIPPTPELHTFQSTGIHLILSHLLDDERYFGYYKKQREVCDDYLILDNSAHEFGKGNKIEDLLKQATALRAQEVVVPDILFDANGTVEAARTAFRYIVKNHKVYEKAGSPRLMIVPQGTDRTDWVKCLNHLLQAYEDAFEDMDMWGPVIGVSKDYDDFVKGGITTLIREYLAPLSVEVHCLGWPTNLWSLARVRQECAWVRSTDSAKPFVYARENILLEPGGHIPQYPKRQPDYFEHSFNMQQREIAARNIRVFDAAATNDLILA